MSPYLNKVKFLFLISTSPYEEVMGWFVGSTLKLKQEEQADNSIGQNRLVKTEQRQTQTLEWTWGPLAGVGQQ
jgi:hypothetical protein